jgi:EmrB/QacA subfamily drug resistance transporter
MPGRTTNRGLTVAALLLAIFMTAMEATVVGTAMPTVIADLGGIALYGWVGASYMLASTIMVPVFGKLADTLGRKPVLMFGTAVFLLGSLASGLSPSIEAMIFARTLQGLGAGAMQPMALTIVGDIFTLEERGKVQAAFGSVWGLSGALGPLLGGLIVTHLSWPWVFWINLPFGIASMVILPMVYQESPRAREPGKAPSIDWLGAVMITGASVLLLLGAERTMPLLTLPLGALLLVAFVVIEQRAASPILPPSLLMRPTVAMAAISGLLLGGAMMGAVLYTPLWAQGARGVTPAEAGSVIATMLVGWPLSAAVANRVVMRFGFRAPVWVGSGLILAGLTLHAGAIATDQSLWWVRLAMFLFGCGMGLTVTAQLLAVQVGAAHHERGVATSSGLFARSMGGALGAGALGAILSASLEGALDAETVSRMLDPHARADVMTADVQAALGAALAPIWTVLVVLAFLNLIAVAFYPRDRRGEVAAAASATPVTAE